MMCSHPIARIVHSILAVMLSLLIALDFSPTRADSAGTAQRQTSGKAWQVFLAGSTVREPTGLAIDLRGSARAAQWGYVADAGSGHIVKFGTGGHVLRSWRYAIPGHPAVLAVGGRGNLFVADMTDGTISKFSPTGTRLAFWTTKYYAPLFSPPYTDPHSIAVDRDGMIYLAEYAEHRVIQLSTGGTLLHTWDTSQGFSTQFSLPHRNSGPLGNPTGVAYDPPNHLFLTTVCVTDPTCHEEWHPNSQESQHDVLLVVNTSGPFAGHAGNIWFGLGYTAANTPVEVHGSAQPLYESASARRRRSILSLTSPQPARYPLGRG